MARDEERLMRSQEEPIVGGLPDVPGILTALLLTPELGIHLRGLADELLVNDFAGATIGPCRAGDARDRRLGGERLLLLHGLARGVRHRSARDDRRRGARPAHRRDQARDRPTGSTPRCRRCSISRAPCDGEPRDLTAADVAAAHGAGATDADVQLAVLIAAAFSMYNRIVEGFRARTPPVAEVYRDRASEIAAHGYSDRRVTSVPG